MDGLADMLPVSVTDEVRDVVASSSSSKKAALRTALLRTDKSLASRPGVQKRRELVGKVEQERFRKNLAVMVGEKPANIGNGNMNSELSTEQMRAERWAALRRHIAQNAEKSKG